MMPIIISMFGPYDNLLIAMIVYALLFRFLSFVLDKIAFTKGKWKSLIGRAVILVVLSPIVWYPYRDLQDAASKDHDNRINGYLKALEDANNEANREITRRSKESDSGKLGAEPNGIESISYEDGITYINLMQELGQESLKIFDKEIRQIVEKDNK